MNPRLLVLILLLASCGVKKDISTAPPVAQQPVKRDSVVVKQIEEKKPEKKSFNLGLFLALNAEHYLENDSVGQPAFPDLDITSNSALHLYEGMLIASAEHDSSIILDVTDAGGDSLKILRSIKSLNNTKSDMIVSVLNPSFNPNIAVASNEIKKPVLIPQHSTSALLTGNPDAWLCTPSNKTQCRQMASWVQLLNRDAAFRFIYRDGNKKESDLADLFYSEILALGADSSSCRKVNFGKDGWNSVNKLWKDGKKNVLFITIFDEAVLTSLFAKLETKEQADIMIIGLPTWEFMETIDYTKLELLNSYIFSTTYIDYENEKVKAFRKKFIEEYHADPLLSAYQGYDYYNWVFNNFPKHGKDIQHYESFPELLSPDSGFRFKKACDNCGRENQYISVLKFQEGRLVKVNR